MGLVVVEDEGANNHVWCTNPLGPLLFLFSLRYLATQVSGTILTNSRTSQRTSVTKQDLAKYCTIAFGPSAPTRAYEHTS